MSDGMEGGEKLMIAGEKLMIMVMSRQSRNLIVAITIMVIDNKEWYY
jgi:hypothetical protein